MKKYVVGFAFDKKQNYVSLILKNRPGWQAGYLNGIGGHVEYMEGPNNAMIREFEEETGYHQSEWNYYITMYFDEVIVWCYYSVVPLEKLKTMTDEKIYITSINDIVTGNVKIINNLQWLIPMALNHKKEPFKSYDITHINH